MAQQTRCPNCGSYNTFKSGTGNVLFEIIAGFIGIITLGLADIVTHPISNVLQERNWIEGKVKAICHTCKFQFTFNDYPEARARRELWQKAAEDEESRRREQAVQPMSQAQEQTRVGQVPDLQMQIQPAEPKKCKR